MRIESFVDDDDDMLNKKGSRKGKGKKAAKDNKKDDSVNATVSGSTSGSNSEPPAKRRSLAVEEKYQKMTQREHIIKRPDTYSNNCFVV